MQANIYENVSELKLSSGGEDKVDGLRATKEFQVWKAADEQHQQQPEAPPVVEATHCVLLRVKKANPDNQTTKSGPTRGTVSYSSSTSSSSYSSSTNSWGSRMKLAMQRKLSSGEGPASPGIDESTDKYPLRSSHCVDCQSSFVPPPRRSDKDNKLAITITKEQTEQEEDEDEDHSEEVSVCQSPISVNSHLQCRSSSVELALPIAAMQEAGLTPEDIKSQKYVSCFVS